ncbi:hypothetical protein TgHK011_001904 [Trichoderma gracile]|nr:hypothetical protein TgHK011_001904 [Trichoderma gracile]
MYVLLFATPSIAFNAARKPFPNCHPYDTTDDICPSLHVLFAVPSRFKPVRVLHDKQHSGIPPKLKHTSILAQTEALLRPTQCYRPQADRPTPGTRDESRQQEALPGHVVTYMQLMQNPGSIQINFSPLPSPFPPLANVSKMPCLPGNGPTRSTADRRRSEMAESPSLTAASPLFGYMRAVSLEILITSSNNQQSK